MTATEFTDKENRKMILERNMYKAISLIIHPVVSPYDLSEANLRAQESNNPYFRQAVSSLTKIVMVQQKT